VRGDVGSHGFAAPLIRPAATFSLREKDSSENEANKVLIVSLARHHIELIAAPEDIQQSINPTKCLP
jgi:hypothetical protein